MGIPFVSFVCFCWIWTGQTSTKGNEGNEEKAVPVGSRSVSASSSGVQIRSQSRPYNRAVICRLLLILIVIVIRSPLRSHSRESKNLTTDFTDERG